MKDAQILFSNPQRDPQLRSCQTPRCLQDGHSKLYNVTHEYQGLLRPEEDTLATRLKPLGLQNVYPVLYSVLSAGLG